MGKKFQKIKKFGKKIKKQSIFFAEKSKNKKKPQKNEKEKWGK